MYIHILPLLTLRGFGELLPSPGMLCVGPLGGPAGRRPRVHFALWTSEPKTILIRKWRGGASDATFVPCSLNWSRLPNLGNSYNATCYDSLKSLKKWLCLRLTVYFNQDSWDWIRAPDEQQGLTREHKHNFIPTVSDPHPWQPPVLNAADKNPTAFPQTAPMSC